MTVDEERPTSAHGVSSLNARHEWLRRAALERLEDEAGPDREVLRETLRAVMDIIPDELPGDSTLTATTRDTAFYRAGQLAILDQLLLTVASLPRCMPESSRPWGTTGPTLEFGEVSRAAG